MSRILPYVLIHECMYKCNDRLGISYSTHTVNGICVSSQSCTLYRKMPAELDQVPRVQSHPIPTIPVTFCSLPFGFRTMDKVPEMHQHNRTSNTSSRSVHSTTDMEQIQWYDKHYSSTLSLRCTPNGISRSLTVADSCCELTLSCRHAPYVQCTPLTTDRISLISWLIRPCLGIVPSDCIMKRRVHTCTAIATLHGTDLACAAICNLSAAVGDVGRGRAIRIYVHGLHVRCAPMLHPSTRHPSPQLPNVP